MKLPNVNVDHTTYDSGQHYVGGLNVNSELSGIVMNGIFGDIWGGIKSVAKTAANTVVGTAPCVLAKAGPKGLSCLTQCGPDPYCLAKCMGSAVYNSVKSCL